MRKSRFCYGRFCLELATLSLALTACGKNEDVKKQQQSPVEVEKEPPAFVAHAESSAESEAFMKNFAKLGELVTERDFSAGLIMAYVTPDGISYRGFGEYANMDKPEDVPFQIASITKTFTGMALASMVNDGVVTLDTTLDDCKPNGVDELPEKYGRISFYELATHTSGLQTDMPGIVNPSIEFYSNVDTIKFWNALPQAKISKRGKHSYSNYGMGLLGSALAVCDGEPDWESLVAKRVTSVLGLDKTSTDLTATNGYGYKMELLPPWSWPKDIGGFAALKSTARDLARVAQMSLTTDDYKGRKMIETSQTRLFDINNAEDVNNGIGYAWFFGYDFGLEEFDISDIVGDIVGHSGGSRTHQTHIYISKEGKFAVVVLDNTANEFGPYIVQLAMALHEGADVQDVLDFADDIWDEKYDASSEEMAQTVGRYNYYGNIIEIKFDEQGKLLAEWDGESQYRIFPTSPVLYFDHTGGYYKFGNLNNSKYDNLTYFYGANQYSFKRITENDSDADDTDVNNSKDGQSDENIDASSDANSDNETANLTDSDILSRIAADVRNLSESGNWFLEKVKRVKK